MSLLGKLGCFAIDAVGTFFVNILRIVSIIQFLLPRASGQLLLPRVLQRTLLSSLDNRFPDCVRSGATLFDKKKAVFVFGIEEFFRKFITPMQET